MNATTLPNPNALSQPISDESMIDEQFIGGDKATPPGGNLNNNKNRSAIGSDSKARMADNNRWLDDIPLDDGDDEEDEVTVESYKEARPSRLSTVSRTFDRQQQLSSMPSRRMVVKKNIPNNTTQNFNSRKDSQGTFIVQNARRQSSTVPSPPMKTSQHPRRSRISRDASMVVVNRKASTSAPITIIDRQRKASSQRKSSSSTSASKKSLVTLRIEDKPVTQRKHSSIKQHRRPSRKSMPVLMEEIQFLPQPPLQRRRSTGTSMASRNRAKRISVVESKRNNGFIDNDGEDVSLEDVMVRLDHRDRDIIMSRRSRSEERHLDGRRRLRVGLQPQGSSLTSGSTDDSGVSYLLVDARICLLYTSPSPRDGLLSRMPSSA